MAWWTSPGSKWSTQPGLEGTSQDTKDRNKVTHEKSQVIGARTRDKRTEESGQQTLEWLRLAIGYVPNWICFLDKLYPICLIWSLYVITSSMLQLSKALPLSHNVITSREDRSQTTKVLQNPKYRSNPSKTMNTQLYCHLLCDNKHTFWLNPIKLLLIATEKEKHQMCKKSFFDGGICS